MEAETQLQEVERLRSLLRRVYPYCLPHPGNEELLAELEREVLRIAVLEGRYGPDGPIPRSDVPS
jgi:phosphoglycolate phosphatase-like HAD superfamily hydrolase